MARKVYAVLEDDLDGGKADETVSFSLDGVSYEIDLTTSNADKMRKALAGYVGAARRVGGRARGRGRSGSSRSSGRTAEIRAWAKDRGMQVNERGRIPANVVAEYEKAQG
ncbi:MAG: histone-like nucleoid-structuring protein Lsr2 [Actinomycetes bacterium]